MGVSTYPHLLGYRGRPPDQVACVYGCWGCRRRVLHEIEEEVVIGDASQSDMRKGLVPWRTSSAPGGVKVGLSG